MVDTSPAIPNVTIVEGNRSVLEKIHLRYTNMGGLLLIGNDHTVMGGGGGGMVVVMATVKLSAVCDACEWIER